MLHQFLGRGKNRVISLVNQVEAMEVDEKNERIDFNRNLKLATNQVMSVAQQLNVTLDENQESTENIFNGAKQMAYLNRETEGELSQMFEEFHGMVARLDQIRRLSNEMETDGKISGEILNRSLKEIVGIVTEIHQINHLTQETLEMVNELKDLSGAITRILDTVGDIAAQTQLLSLNASIESARAGAAGAGFAVVADRIKKLSDDSHSSVKHIRGLIDKVLKSNQKVNQKMNDTAQKVTESVIKFQQIEESMANVNHSFEVLVNKSQNVNAEVSDERKRAVGIQQQVVKLQDKSKEVLFQVENVYGGIKKQRSSINELTDLGLRLNQSAGILQPMILNDSEIIDIKEEFHQKAREMVDIIKTKVETFTRITELTENDSTHFLKKLIAEHPILEAVWLNDIKGRFIMSIPPAGIANAKVREWFMRGVAGQEFISTPYVSAITGKPCVTIAIPVLNFQKEIKGVLGVDLQC